MKQLSKIKERIWGFNIKEVDDHFIRLMKAQEMELEELTKRMEECQRENEILRQELSTLTDTNLSLPAGVQLELALKRLERVAGYIDQDVVIEVLAIDKISRQNSLVLENTIAEIDKDIEKKKEIIEKELKNIVDIARGKEKTKNINFEVLKSIGKVLPIAEWLKNNKEEQPNLGNQFCGEEPTSCAQELVKQMPSKGTTLESTQKPDATKVISADLDSNRIDITSDDKRSEDFIDSGYQENEETKDNGYSVFGSALQSSRENVEPFPSKTILEFCDAEIGSFKKVNSSIQEVVATRDSETKLPTQDSFRSAETFEIQSKAIPYEQLHTGVHEEISFVHDRNIIERVVGEDIIDGLGKIIIRKDEPITLNIMQLAQKADKLAELIIHMALPRQED